MLAVLVITVALLLRSLFVSSFYEGYFRQKQRNEGIDPQKVIRDLFPFLWWLF